jgi:dienelactone hydrolase
MKLKAPSLSATLAACLALPIVALAEIKTTQVEYQDGSSTLQGWISYDDASKTRRPGVLVVHDWLGVSAHTKSIVEELAGMGYVAFAADIYGKGIRPSGMAEAAAESGKYKADRALLRRRAQAGLAELQKSALTDKNRIAAIGFCFGGTTVLELARSGAPIQGAVSFHGGLDSPTPADGKNIRAKLLVLHGADDPFVKTADITAFQDELRQAGVDWQMVYFGNAVHSFTQKSAGHDKSKGAAYHEPSAKRSWTAMKTFFGEIFAPK